ncbi:MAG: hypothetical protein ABJB66_21465 [Gemmatimonadaceae bacterium]
MRSIRVPKPSINLAIAAAMFMTACIHQSGQSKSNPASHATDGLFAIVKLDAADALETATNALISQGFVIATERSRHGSVVTAPLTIVGDSTMTISADVTVVDKNVPSSVITYSATFSSASQHVRNQLVVNTRNRADPLWSKLSAVFNALPKAKE